MTLVTLLGFVFVVWLVAYVIGKLPVNPRGGGPCSSSSSQSWP
jgi:hypothetical protein